jgi:hypothetical protein
MYVDPDELGVLYLVDDDVGVSMTNDAEAVCRWADECFPRWRVVYKDTMGRWDIMTHDRGTFMGFMHGPQVDEERLEALMPEQVLRLFLNF